MDKKKGADNVYMSIILYVCPSVATLNEFWVLFYVDTVKL